MYFQHTALGYESLLEDDQNFSFHFTSQNSSAEAYQDVSHLVGIEDSETETEAKITEDETAASDDESESDDEDSRHRGRFKTERTTTSGSLLSKSRNKLEKRDIPDKLGMYVGNQEKLMPA
jgi:hypothetical protein